MKIRLRYFASIREKLGREMEVVEPGAAVATLGQLREWLCARGEPWSEALAEGRSLRMACDQQMAAADHVLRDECEVAFFPPVTGG